MPDIEKAVKGLYEIHAYFRDSVNAMRGGTADCTVFNGWAMTVADALALLKEQEVIPHKNYADLNMWWCGCGWGLGGRGTLNYCPNCGRKVKWE